MRHKEEICGYVDFCPARYVTTATATNFAASDRSQVITIRSYARAQLTTTVQQTDGGRLTQTTVTLNFNDPTAIRALLKSGYGQWVVRLHTISGYTRVIGSPICPAEVDYNTTDTAGTISITAYK